MLSSVQADHDVRCLTWDGWWHGALLSLRLFSIAATNHLSSPLAVSQQCSMSVFTFFPLPHSHLLTPADFIFFHIHFGIKCHFRSLCKERNISICNQICNLFALSFCQFYLYSSLKDCGQFKDMLVVAVTGTIGGNKERFFIAILTRFDFFSSFFEAAVWTFVWVKCWRIYKSITIWIRVTNKVSPYKTYFL